MGLLQFTTFQNNNVYYSNSILDNFYFFGFVILMLILLIIIAIIFIARSFLRSRARHDKSIERMLLQVLVPKERKSEGSGGQAGQDDRLEQVKEEIALTETFFASIAGLKAERGFSAFMQNREDHFGFEIVGRGGLIYFYIDTPSKYSEFIILQVQAQYPHAEIDKVEDYNLFSESSKILGAYLTPQNPSVFPFRTFKTLDSDPLSSPLNTMSKIISLNDGAAIQFVIRSAKRQWRSNGIKIVREVKKGKKFEDVISKNFISQTGKFIGKGFSEAMSAGSKNSESSKSDTYQISSKEEEMLKGIEEKLSKGGMDLTVRLISVSESADNVRTNLDNLINSFGLYNSYRYGNSFIASIPRNQTKLIRDFIYRGFEHKRSVVVNTEEMASLWHPPLNSTEAPNIKWLSGRKSPPPPDLPKEGLHMGYVSYRGSKTEVFIKEADRRRHLYIIGKSGTGKSVLISNLAIQDILAGHGVCVVDPHGDLIEAVLEHIPKERAEDVIVFDPSDLERPIGLNMLEPKTEDQRDFAVQEMISIFYKLFPPEMIGPMFEHQMRNVMLTLMADIKNPGTIIDIPRMFTDDEYVKLYLAKLKDPVVRAYWEKEVAKTSDFHKSEMLGYLVSKVGRFVANEMMRNIMGQQKSGFDFRDVMDKQKILLVNLAKGKTGEVNAKLLGLIVVAKLQMAAMGRANMNEEDRKDFYLYIDEFQNFITDSISTILSEARKYKLDLIIAHQYMGQLTDSNGKSDVRDAVLGNVGTMCVGRIGPDDAEILAKEMAPTFGSYDLLNPPPFSYYTKMLIDGKASRPFNMSTYPPKKGNRELASAIKELSRLKFGRDRVIVEAEIMDRTKLGESGSAGKTDSHDATR